MSIVNETGYDGQTDYDGEYDDENLSSLVQT